MQALTFSLMEVEHPVVSDLLELSPVSPVAQVLCQVLELQFWRFSFRVEHEPGQGNGGQSRQEQEPVYHFVLEI